MAQSLPLRLLLLLGALTALGPLTMDLYLPAFGDLSADLRISASVTQLTITSYLVGFAVGQLVGGPLSDAFGRRRPLLAGMAAFIAVTLLCAIAPSATMLVGARALQGMAGATVVVIALAMVRDVVEGDAAARAYSLLIGITGLGPLIAPVIGGQLLAFTDWRGTFFAVALTGTVVAVTAAVALPETRDRAQRATAAGASFPVAMRTLAADRWFVGVTLCLAFAFATVVVYVAGAPFVLEEIHGLSPQTVGLVLASISAVFIVVSQIGARVVLRTGAARLLTIGCVIGVVGAVALTVAVALGAGLAVVLAAMTVTVASRGLVYSNAQALAVQDHPDMAGTASGVVGVFRYGAGAALAPLAGIAGAHDAMPMTILILATSVGASLALLYGCRGRRERARVGSVPVAE